jgi:hypothetical protein
MSDTAPTADTTGTGTDNITENSEPTKRWRAVHPVHPAAELFPLMNEAELRELADDIKKHGLREEVTLYDDPELGFCLLDGRNRLDALELLGRETVYDHGGWPPGIYTTLHRSRLDPFAYVISKNIQRRHLTADQRRELIAKVLKAKPETSNRQIAAELKVDHKKVAAVRAEREATGEIPPVEKTRGKDGKARPSRRQLSKKDIAAMSKWATRPKAKEATPTSRPSPSKLPTPDEIVESGPVDAICATLAEMAKRDPALGQACFDGIVAAMDRASETDHLPC